LLALRAFALQITYHQPIILYLPYFHAPHRGACPPTILNGGVRFDVLSRDAACHYDVTCVTPHFLRSDNPNRAVQPDCLLLNVVFQLEPLVYLYFPPTLLQELIPRLLNCWKLLLLLALFALPL
jgi:hypothetical protein